jgi:hypothetical protein
VLVSLVLQSCQRINEGQLIGAWRGEKDGAVDELLFNPDHSLILWSCPAELTTPQAFVYTGTWRTRWNRIEIDSKSLTTIGLSRHLSFRVLELKDALVVENKNENAVFRLMKFDLPVCGSLAPERTTKLDEPSFVGKWRVHFHTHDFEYRFASDHTVNVLGKVSVDFDPLWNGQWSVSNDELVMDLKGVSGMRNERPRWGIYGFRHDCFSIKDPEGVAYTLRRIE